MPSTIVQDIVVSPESEFALGTINIELRTLFIIVFSDFLPTGQFCMTILTLMMSQLMFLIRFDSHCHRTGIALDFEHLKEISGNPTDFFKLGLIGFAAHFWTPV